ncbi:MAG: MFS transporter, partial [Solirubrobacteraceae bacterium]
MKGRARYTSMIFFMSALGAFFGIWVGLLLTTGPTPFPLGLPFALAGSSFSFGWRIMYAIGAVLALVGVLLRFQLPESPRWLVSRRRVDDAETVVRGMEERASRRHPLPEPQPDQSPVEEVQVGGSRRTAFVAIFGNPVYVRRMILLLVTWFIAYITVYSYASGYTSALTSLGYAPPEAGLMGAVGTLGFIACAVVAFLVGERMERRRWLPLASLITLAGAVVVGLGGKLPVLAFAGSIVIFFGFNLWVPMTYTWSTESFPTRARTTGFALGRRYRSLGGRARCAAPGPADAAPGTAAGAHRDHAGHGRRLGDRAVWDLDAGTHPAADQPLRTPLVHSPITPVSRESGAWPERIAPSS